MTEKKTPEPQEKKAPEPHEFLLSRLRKVSGSAIPQRLERLRIHKEFPGLSFVWVRDYAGASEVAQYKAMGYEVFELPPGVEAAEVCPAASVDGGHLRVDDVILMYTSEERVKEIMAAISNNLKMTKIEQSDMIQTGAGEDAKPAGKESDLQLEAREVPSPEKLAALMEQRNK